MLSRVTSSVKIFQLFTFQRNKQSLSESEKAITHVVMAFWDSKIVFIKNLNILNTKFTSNFGHTKYVTTNVLYDQQRNNICELDHPCQICNFVHQRLFDKFCHLESWRKACHNFLIPSQQQELHGPCNEWRLDLPTNQIP